jgi:Transposase DDE domain
VVTTRRQGKHREYVAHLLMHSYREDGKVKKETVANLSHLPEDCIELIRGRLAGEQYVKARDHFKIERALPHGHVEAVLAMAKRLELGRLLDRTPSKERDLILAMIVQRIIDAGSKLFTTRAFAQSTLGEELHIEDTDADELYAAMDWLLARGDAIQTRLARRHLRNGEPVLYDLSSSYFEGRCCPLAMHGYSRDQRRGSLQIVYGLMCDRVGRPIAVEVFAGNTLDAQTVPNQVTMLRERFELREVVFVSDRGMVTKTNLEALAEADIDWITALKAPQVKALAEKGALPLSLFEERNLAEITDPAYPDERLIVCRNPLVGQERRRKREELLGATEAELNKIAVRVAAGSLEGEGDIGVAVGLVINRYKMRKHFDLQIDDRRLAFPRKSAQIAAEAALDGIYILRTSTESTAFSSTEVVRSYKQLAHVERAFRTLKQPDLEIRPIYHHLESRVRAHVLLCMLAYYVEWHLRQAWTELLFADPTPPIAEDPVAKAQRSTAAQRKAQRQRTPEGGVVHSFRSLLNELALRTRNTVRIGGTPGTFSEAVEPSPIQSRALNLISQLPIET